MNLTSLKKAAVSVAVAAMSHQLSSKTGKQVCFRNAQPGTKPASTAHCVIYALHARARPGCFCSSDSVFLLATRGPVHT